MGLFNNFPYMDLSNLNLDFVLKKLKDLTNYTQSAEQAAESAEQSASSAQQSAESAEQSASSAQQSAERAEESAESAQDYAEHIADPVGGLVTDWLDENITPTTPPVDASLSIQGAAADAKATGDAINAISTIPTEVKQAMDTLFHKMAIINSESESFESEYLIIHNWADDVRLVSISAAYTQTGDVFETDSLESLKNGLTVTARYDNGTTEEVTSYTLSGELTEGTSTITVTYHNKTASFTVTVKSWTAAWDYTDGGLPATVAPDDWTETINPSGNITPTVTFDNGIKFVGRGGGYVVNPRSHQTTEVGVMEVIANFSTVPSDAYDDFNVRATLNAASDTLIGFLFKDGVKINGSGSDYNFIPNTSITLGEDHTLRVERSASAGHVYLDGNLVYSGVLRELSGTNNVLISFVGNASTPCTLYLKAIRFYHES